MVYVNILRKLLRDPNWKDLIVPIVPDEARTFGMEALFRQIGIYSTVGQLYEPVDRENLLFYKESRDGQILEEASLRPVQCPPSSLPVPPTVTTGSIRSPSSPTTRCSAFSA